MPKSYNKTFKELTEEDIVTISRHDLTNNEICEMVGITPGATLSRWRKKLNIFIPRGCKPGIKRPYRVKPLEERTCKFSECDITFKCSFKSKQKYCCIICSIKDIDRSYMQTEEYKKTLIKPHRDEYKSYSGKVHRLSQKTYESNKEIINPKNLPRALSGVVGGYQLDHIITIKEGFEKNISPEEMSKVENLRILPWKENLMRNKRGNHYHNV